MLNLETDIININRVGAATAKKLKKLGVETARDLLFYFPFRYDDFSRVTPISQLAAGSSANAVGRIELIQNKRSPRRRMNITEALINDDSETLKVIWFNQPFITRQLKVGDTVSLAGKLEDDYGGLTMLSPVYEKVTPLPPPLSGGRNITSLPPFARGVNLRPPFKGGLGGLNQGGKWQGGGQAIHTQGLVPNYHLTAKLTHKQVRFLIKQVMGLADKINDWLPWEVKKGAGLVSLGQAVKKIHFPKNNLEAEKARERLAFEELFLIQLESQLTRKNLSQAAAPLIEFQKEATKKFVAGLPFKLTNAQRRAAWEILKDMAKARPMARLLEGDVGSGKTLVAIIAMLNVALNGKQSALMVPTEILARQHYDTLGKFLAGFDVKVGLVTRSQKLVNYELRITNYELNANVKNSKIDSQFIVDNADIIIGTHALIQEDVKFKNLALAVIDEQHRFGVEQRKTLVSKTSLTSPYPSPSKGEGTPGEEVMPHLLSMTATPIPRSLALALYGDLDLSVINEMPRDRKKIITKVVAEDQRQAAYQFIREQIKAGRQVFVVCPLIDWSDKLGVKSVEEEHKKLDKIIFPDLAIGKLHGRLKSGEKEKIMREFLQGKIKILVATAVVEVGVDAPNAAVMMIEGAERFGLAQIHQFRGRVGRSRHQSYCFLFTESRAENALKRLEALVNHDNGFALAKLDLKFRGPGEVYGTEQKGFPELKIASLFDYGLMKQARDQAVRLIGIDPGLNRWPALKQRLSSRSARAHLE